MQRTLVILVVGLSPALVGAHTPNLAKLAARGAMRPLNTVTPAVTCTVQSTLVTGLPPSGHGAVANGWFFRDLKEVLLWRQPNNLVEGEKIWDAGKKRDEDFTCAKMFWWYNMYASAEWSVTPRPQYRADGRKIPDCYSQPAVLRDTLQRDLGPFPLFRFWGPAASNESTRWIADASVAVDKAHDPTLTLVYLPHLDYALQKYGPGSPEARAADTEVDAVVGGLIDHYESRGARVMIVSEYGIEPVSGAVRINRVLRSEGLVAVREENGRELLDAGASRAFAVADHQVAHVYVREAADLPAVKALCERTAGVDLVLDGDGKRAHGIDHGRAGDLVLVAEAGKWFSYYHWLDDDRAPDFARCVDIHRKPGYDPCELFIDPAIRFPRVALGSRLIRKKLGFCTLMDVIPLDDSLVRGSHGRVPGSREAGPLMMSKHGGGEGEMPVTGVRDAILESLFSAG